MMYLSESIVRAIHTDRVREIERATRERRLVEAGAEPVAAAAEQRRSADRRMPPATSQPGLSV
jgi:hypothetical protein